MKERLKHLPMLLIGFTWFALIGYSLVSASTPTGSLRYGIHSGVPIITPIETEVCSGDMIHYPTLTFVEERAKSQVNIAEAWCRAGLEGGCIGVFPDRPDMPLLEPKEIINPATPRIVPETLGPGIWHFQHSATDELGRVSGYIVAPINVLKCEKPTLTSP
jgi:hypothetical protein